MDTFDDDLSPWAVTSVGQLVKVYRSISAVRSARLLCEGPYGAVVFPEAVLLNSSI